MPYNILILPLLGGFLFVTFWDRTRWHAHRAEKDRLLIYAALAGLGSLALAYLIRSIPPFIPCIDRLCWSGLCVIPVPCPPSWWDKNIGFPHSGVAAFAFFVGAVGWLPLNLIADWHYKDWADEEHRGSKRREFVRVVNSYGGPLEQLLLRSMQEEKSVMLTLKGGKVYIGDLGSTFIPGEHTAIHLLPSKSGYRDKCQRLTITTDYDDATAKIMDREPDADNIIASFVIAIPVDEVVAASLYLPEIHAQYFPHHLIVNEPLEMD
jgi:hypothetical protein